MKAEWTDREGMYNFNFIGGTQKVLHSQPFLSMDYGTVSELQLLGQTVCLPYFRPLAELAMSGSFATSSRRLSRISETFF